MKLVLILFSLLVLPIVAAIERGPILSAEEPHTAMIANFRTENVCAGQVKFRQIGGITWSNITETTSGTSHAIEMPISSFTEYEYIVLADGDSTGPFSFWSAPAPGALEDFDFCAYGDTRTGLLAHWVIIDHIMDCDPMFVTNSGDMIEDGEDTSDWDNYFAELCEWHNIAQSVPYFYAMGNHDDEAPYFYDALRLPQNPSGNEAYGSFDWGRIHFTVINSEIDYSITSDQYEFVSNDLSAAAINPDYDFVIALVHRPLYSSGYHGREDALAEAIEPLLVANAVDLVIQGHDHMYERSHPQDGVIYLVTGGGGAPPSPIFYWLSHCAYGYNLYHHLDFHYSAAEHKLSMFMHDYDDDIVDSLTLIAVPVGINEGHSDIKEISVYPNPFNASCRIVGPRDIGEIEIFDMSGRQVRRSAIIDGHFNWDGTDEFGAVLPTGVYYVRPVIGTASAARIVLIR